MEAGGAPLRRHDHFRTNGAKRKPVALRCSCNSSMMPRG